MGEGASGQPGSHPTCICTESLRVMLLRAAHHLAQPGTPELGSQGPGSYIPGALCLQFICFDSAVGLAAAPVAWINKPKQGIFQKEIKFF